MLLHRLAGLPDGLLILMLLCLISTLDVCYKNAMYKSIADIDTDTFSLSVVFVHGNGSPMATNVFTSAEEGGYVFTSVCSSVCLSVG